MKRFIVFFSLLVLLLAGGALLAVKIFINTDHIKQQAEDTLSGIGSSKVTINGEVAFELFPKPLLIFEDIQFANIEGAASSNLLSIRQARAHIAWNNIFSHMPSFKDLTLIAPVLELELLENGNKNWHALKPVNNVSPKIGSSFIPSDINIEDGRIVYRVQTDKTELSQISLNVAMDSWNGPFDATGSFTFQSEQISLTAKIGDLNQSSDASFTFSSPSFDTSFEGKTEGGGTLNMSGITKTQINNLGAFTGGVFPVSSLPTHITSAEALDIEGAFSFSDQGFSLRQLSFDSESIKASAEIKASLSSSSIWDIQAHIDLLNIDELTKGTDQNVSILSSPEAMRFSIPKETSLLFFLTADKIVFRKDNILNTTFDAALTNQQFVIHSLEGIVPGKSDFMFTGAVTHNGIRPLLEGDIELNGTNFNALLVWLYPQYNFIPKEYLRRFVFNSKLSMMPTRIRASDIRGNVDDIGIEGEFEMRPEERMPSYRFDFELDRIDLTKLHVSHKIVSSYEQLRKDIKDPFANSFISKLHGKYTFLIRGKNFFLNNNKLDQATLDLTLSANRIELRNLSINAEDSDLTITYDSVLTGEKPTLNASLVARALNIDLFFPPQESDEAWAWSKERFNFLGVEKFTGSFKAKVGYLKYRRLRAQNIKIDSTLKDGVITLSRAQGSIGGGPFIVKGKLGIGDANSFGLSYGVNGCEMADILYIFDKDVGMRGKLYASGKATSFGGTPLSVVNNMTGSVKLSAKNILVNNLGLTNLIQKAPLLKSAIDLDTLKQHATNNGTTLFNAAAGNIEFKNGIASTKDLKAATKYSRGVFAANLDLRNFLFKALSKHRFAINSKQSLSVDFDLSGPFTSPKKEIDVSKIEKFITDRAKRR